MSEEEEYKEALPRSAESERKLFDNLFADEAGYKVFRRSLSSTAAKSDQDDIRYARESADHIQTIFDLLVKTDPEAVLNERERATLHDAQALVTHGLGELFRRLAELPSPAEKGDALYALSAMVEATFYIGRCSTAAQEALMRAAAEQRSRAGRLGAEASIERRKEEAGARQQWILAAAEALLQAEPKKRYLPESLAAVLDDETTWPKERFRKVAYSTILSDLRDLVRDGSLILRSKT